MVSRMDLARPELADDPAARAEDDRELVDALRAGEERAFAALVERHGPTMLRVAMLYVRNRAVAEEVVQDAWLGALAGLDRFEGRSSLKTWLFRILTNTALTRAQREGRSVPFSSLAGDDDDEGSPSVDADRFLPTDHRWANHWASSPTRFDTLPESRLLSSETVAVTQAAIAALPEAQRAVITMRDIVGCSSEEVCEQLSVSEANQRVLLHRARSKVRQALEQHFEQGEG
jgi:RNA polymerase sigma-70 factor (ECF subfamily)